MKLATLASWIALSAVCTCAGAQHTDPALPEIESYCDNILGASAAPEWRDQLEKLRDQCVALTLATPGTPDAPCDPSSYQRGECVAR